MMDPADILVHRGVNMALYTVVSKRIFRQKISLNTCIFQQSP